MNPPMTSLDQTQLAIYQPRENPPEYERPPLDWRDMDPTQRLTWLREHQLPNPNQKPSKLMLTETQKPNK